MSTVINTTKEVIQHLAGEHTIVDNDGWKFKFHEERDELVGLRPDEDGDDEDGDDEDNWTSMEVGDISLPCVVYEGEPDYLYEYEVYVMDSVDLYRVEFRIRKDVPKSYNKTGRKFIIDDTGNLVLVK